MENKLQKDELRHYGVIGMRWGVRRAARKGQPYNYRSHGQKKWQKRVDKLGSKDTTKKSTQRKINKAERKLETFKQRDRNRADYVKTTGAGRSVVKGILFGPIGSGSYNRMRAAGHGRVSSAVVSNVIASTFSLPINVILTRNEEFKSANNQRRAIEYFREEQKRLNDN